MAAETQSSPEAEQLKVLFEQTHGVVLEDRGASWTPDEIRAVDQVVGLLPQAFVSGNANLKTIVRDREYDGEYDGAPGHGMYRESAGPDAKKDYVVLYDKGVYEDGQISPGQIATTLIHEISHSLDDELPGPYKEWLELSGWFTEGGRWHPQRDTGFLNEYSRGHPKEDFAEAFSAYVLTPDRLERVSPLKFMFMDRLFKQGG
jgi:hypothetical protein